MRKTYNYFLILFLSTVIFSCSKVDEFTQFNVTYDSSVTIESSTGINLPFNLISPDIQSNSETLFESNNTNKDLIEEIKLTKLSMYLSSPSNSDFSFLNSIKIYINADGLAEQLVAWDDNIPDNTTSNTLELNVSDTDLKEFIKKDNFSLRVETVTDEILTSDHVIDITTDFFIDAKILGI